MPLRALVNGIDKISIDYSDQEWIQLKSDIKNDTSTVLLGCCREKGFLRTSSRGLKHFVHYKVNSNCNWKPETMEHLLSKAEVIKACHECGWEAIPEYSESDWRADVLARNNNIRIAFEIQWSKQTLEETKIRQAKYDQSKVRGCWFFKSVPRELESIHESIEELKEVPLFKIVKTEDGQILVKHNSIDCTLKDFVKKLLNREVRFCNHLNSKLVQEVQISIFPFKCWKCFKEQYLYTISSPLVSYCGKEITPINTLWNAEDLDKHPNIINAVREFIESNNADEIKIGKIKERYSHTVHKRYLSHGCYYCDAIFGDFFLSDLKAEVLYDPALFSFKCTVQLGDNKREHPHWCISTGDGFCE